VRILAIKLKQIGDTLLWEPALRRIKETFPDSELWVLTNSYSFPVIKNAPYVNEFLVFDKKKGLLHTFKFLKKLRKISFDIVINFSPGDRSHLFSFFAKGKEKFSYYSAKKAGVQKKIFSNVFTPPDTHTVLQDLWLVNQIFNLKLTSPKVNLYLNDEVLNKAEKILKRFGIEKNNFVCVHPVAKWFLKCWKPEYYGEIMSFFVKNGLQVVITSGKSQKELSFVENILKNTSPKLIKEKRVVNLAGILSIDELGGILYFSKVFFGIDTAPMHMAAALNKPVIAIFGYWKTQLGPLGQRCNLGKLRIALPKKRNSKFRQAPGNPKRLALHPLRRQREFMFLRHHPT